MRIVPMKLLSRSSILKSGISASTFSGTPRELTIANHGIIYFPKDNLLVVPGAQRQHLGVVWHRAIPKQAIYVYTYLRNQA